MILRFRRDNLRTLDYNESGLRLLIFFLCFFISAIGLSQTLGGSAAYNFLRLPSSALITAMGGENISYKTNEASISANNPSLLNNNMSTQISASFTSFLAGVKTYSLTGAYHSEKLETNFGGHIYFVDYGVIPATDAAGNQSGSFRPVDYVVQFSGARKYLDKWAYGLTMKFINSSYQQYTSNALAVDVGVNYFDSSRQLSLSFLAKNMGVQLKTYAGEKEELPFDLQVGITKRLAKAPFGFSLTAQHLQYFNTNYNDTVFNNDNGASAPSPVSKLFNHFVLATHIYIGQNLEAMIGYNQLRRQELSSFNGGNGLAGFSAGLRIRFSQLQILYARSSYQKGVNYNQIGVSAQLNKLLSF